MREEHAGVAGVLAGYQIHFRQGIAGPQGDIAEISNGGGDNIKMTGLH
jgi:hypothetical protein